MTMFQLMSTMLNTIFYFGHLRISAKITVIFPLNMHVGLIKGIMIKEQARMIFLARSPQSMAQNHVVTEIACISIMHVGFWFPACNGILSWQGSVPLDAVPWHKLKLGTLAANNAVLHLISAHAITTLICC